jgi:lysyl-tRNA synthetase class 2
MYCRKDNERKGYMGKANFAVFQDGVGKIQFYIKQDDICPSEDKSMYQQV